MAVEKMVKNKLNQSTRIPPKQQEKIRRICEEVQAGVKDVAKKVDISNLAPLRDDAFIKISK